MTSIHVDDPSDGMSLPELPPLPIGALVAGTLNLLQEAADLPEPRYLTVSDSQHIGVQFDNAKASMRALTRWARRFGGLVVSEPAETEYGPHTYCHAEFTYYGVDVKAYAFIPAAPAAT